MEKEQNIKKGKKYLLIGVLVLFLAILGSSVAYYLARVQGSLSGRAAGTGLDLTITPLSTSATGDLIPLDNDVETLNLAAKGYGNEGSTFDSTKSCIDINGYSVCQIYRIRVTNNGSVPLTMNGTVELSGANTPNIDCAKMDDEVNITNNNSCMGTNTLASNVVLPANDHLDYYVMVYINNLDEPQYDSGEFNGTVTFTTIDGKKVKGRFKREETLVEHITDLYNSAEKTIVHHSTYVLDDNSSSASGVNNTNKKVNSMLLNAAGTPTSPGTPTTIDYHYATSVGLMNDRLGGTTESLDDGNIRYYGENPNNYIDIGDKYTEDVYQWQFFGASSLNECIDDWGESEEYCTTKIHDTGDQILWRIIGVFDGKVRIVRDEPIGGYSYDTSSSDINSGNGINEWSQADLMKLLNPGYNSESVGGSLYWNSGSGYCYNGRNNFVTECDFTNTGLSEEAKEYIVDQTLYLGGFDNLAVFANQSYILERGSNVFTDFDDYYNDNITRTTRWTGKVGLMYPSDYGYATDLNNCNSKSFYDYGDATCTENNWLKTEYMQWIISPELSGDIVLNVNENGNVRHNNAYRNYVVNPVLTLSPDTFILGGIGTSDDPYVITD